jgi:four helix bundle protein
VGFVDYQEQDVWRESRKLVALNYDVVKNFPKDEIFGLTNQLKRASVSIVSNIAEGCGRNTTKDSLPFFYISRCSLFESEAQLLVASDLHYIDKEKLEEILSQLTSCKKILNGCIRYKKKVKSKHQYLKTNK